MRFALLHFVSGVGVLALAAGCTGDPVGEAPTDGSVDSSVDPSDARDDTRVDTKDVGPSESSPSDTDAATADVEDDAPTIPAVGKYCSKTEDCDPDGTTGAQCLLQAPTPICYGAKCTSATHDPTISPCPDDGVCLDDGASGGLCVPLCYFEPATGEFAQRCIGKNACWFVGSAIIAGKGYIYGRCEGRCGSDADCPGGTTCQEDGLCAVVPKTFAAIGDPCLAADDGTKCACVYGLATRTGYCSKFCHVGDASSCPAGYTCDADVPSSVSAVPADGMLGNCLKDCTADGDCTNAYCEQHGGGVGTKTCQPGAR